MPDLWLEFTKNEWWSSNDRLHWAVKSKLTKNARSKARDAAVVAGLPVFDRAHVTAWISYPRASKADPSNAAPCVKALLDGITDADGYGWVDDDSTHVVAVTYRRGPHTKRPGTWVIRLQIEEENT
ncbi:hypothetical protein [Oerskovia enterophila]|uniref:hypothetical protein n=1 Tax=Oerskovia enterophila TaxID=43678 RepID=UPI0037FB81C9